MRALVWQVEALESPKDSVTVILFGPTVFADVSNEMRIAKEEIFGPMLSIIPFDTEDDAIKMSNDTSYGLFNYVQSGNIERTQRVSRRLRAGMVQTNGAWKSSRQPIWWI